MCVQPVTERGGEGLEGERLRALGVSLRPLYGEKGLCFSAVMCSDIQNVIKLQ